MKSAPGGFRALGVETMKIHFGLLHITIIHPGSRELRPFAFCLSLGQRGRFDPAFAGYVGAPDDPRGWTHRMAYAFRRDNGHRFARTVIGGATPYPLTWF